MSDCSFCGQFADESLSVRHRGCGCVSHADCLPDTTRVGKLCANHDPAFERPAAIANEVQVGGKGAEPRPTDGVDYVLAPGAKQRESTLKTVASYVPGLAGKVKEDVRTSQNPDFLIKNHVSVDTILKQNKLGLQHFLKAGVTLSDLLKNGYTWSDLLKFEDLSKKGPERALQAITIGLKATANHFRDYPAAFPFQKVKAHTEFENRDMCLLFRMTFPEDGPLECDGDQSWNARDCVKLGLTIDDLCDFGLYYKQQYEDLFNNIPQKEAAIVEQKLKTTIAHVEQFADLNDMFAPVPEPMAVSVPAPTPAPVRATKVKIAKKQVVAVVESSSEEEEEEEEVQVRPVKVKAVKAPVQARINHVPPTRRETPELRSYAQRNREKFSRHGALVSNK